MSNAFLNPRPAVKEKTKTVWVQLPNSRPPCAAFRVSRFAFRGGSLAGLERLSLGAPSPAKSFFSSDEARAALGPKTKTEPLFFFVFLIAETRGGSCLSIVVLIAQRPTSSSPASSLCQSAGLGPALQVLDSFRRASACSLCSLGIDFSRSKRKSQKRRRTCRCLTRTPCPGACSNPRNSQIEEALGLLTGTPFV